MLVLNIDVIYESLFVCLCPRIRDRTLALKSKHFVCGSTLEKTLHEMRVKTYQDLWAERREQDVDKPEW